MEGEAAHNQLFKILTAQQFQTKQTADDSDQHACPFCNAQLRPNADICESCGKWVLEGKCCYCYRPIKSEQKFCAQCGNSPKGIACKNCGVTSQFDYCTNCDNPLSKKAIIALNAINYDPEIEAIKKSISEKKTVPRSGSSDNDLRQLQNYLTAPPAKTSDKPKSFTFQSENKDLSENINAQTPSNQPSTDHSEAALLAKVKQLQDKIFGDNQSARLYYSTLKLKIPELRKCGSLLGWQCNYSSTVHFNGPEGCAGPSEGGRWICKDDVEWVSVDSFMLEGELFSPIAAEVPKGADPQGQNQ